MNTSDPLASLGVDLSRRQFLGTSARALAGAMLAGSLIKHAFGAAKPLPATALSEAGKPSRQPNIIFILMDDMGWRDLGCYGSTFYETPNLDRMSAEGMRFTDAYAAAPVCSPTRASLMTGKYPATVGVTEWIGGNNRGRLLGVPYIRQLPLEERSIATALKERGYKTWHVGKWHLGEQEYYPDKHGFEVNIGGVKYGSLPGGYFSPYKNEMLPDGPEGEYLTDRLTDEAIQLICKNDDSPFFLNLWHYAPHIPIQAPADLVKKYEAKRLALGLDKVKELEEGEYFQHDMWRGRRVVRRLVQSDPVYAAMIENVDTNIGRLMDALKEKGIDDNTIIFFYSDNGGLATTQGSPTCNAPLSQGKSWMYEGGVREPLLVRWPGNIPAGTVCDTPVTTPDFYPTLLALAGGDLSKETQVEGIDIRPLLTGGKIPERPIFWHYPHYGPQGGLPAAAVRLGEWKLIRFFEDEHCTLYNLRMDIGEKNNLATACPERVAELRGMLDAWLNKVNAKIPAKNPDWIEIPEGG